MSGITITMNYSESLRTFVDGIACVSKQIPKGLREHLSSCRNSKESGREGTSSQIFAASVSFWGVAD
jgi:hypothetical protein